MIMTSFSRNLRCFWFEMLNNQSVSDSQFSSIGIANYNTSCRASSGWRIGIITSGTASAAMNKKGVSSTHFRFFLGLQIESTGPVNCRMHNVCAISEFICCSRQRANINYTLFSGVIESISRTRVSVSINSILT